MKNYYRLVIGILLMMGGCNFTNDYFSDEKRAELQQKIQNIEQLIAVPSEAMAILDSVYTVTTVKILGAPVKLYETKYFFTVNDQRYSGIYQPTEPPSIALLNIKYLAGDPSVNSPDPGATLLSLKTSETSKTSLYIGLFLLCVGAITIYTNYRQIRGRKKAQEAATQREIEEFNKSKGVNLNS